MKPWEHTTFPYKRLMRETRRNAEGIPILDEIGAHILAIVDVHQKGGHTRGRTCNYCRPCTPEDTNSGGKANPA